MDNLLCILCIAGIGPEWVFYPGMLIFIQGISCFVTTVLPGIGSIMRKVFYLLSPALLLLCFMAGRSILSKQEATYLPKEPAASFLPSYLLFEETFEGPEPFSKAVDKKDHLGTWDYAFRIVSNPVFMGKRSARFEIRKDQPLVKKGKRAEVEIVKGARGDIKQDTWYSFAAYFPSEGYEYDNEREVISQWYQQGTPATSLRTRKDRFLLESGNDISDLKKHDLGPIAKDSWHEFVFHFIHSYTSSGLIEVWLDGNKVLSVKGGNMYKDVLPKWKIGLYKASFKKETSLVSRRIIFFDQIRVGNEKASFEKMTSIPVK